MSSFRVIDKKARLKLGILVVVIIHIGMFYGFWRVYAKQIGNKVYEMDIYAAKDVGGLAFYEAIPADECIKVINEQAPRPGMPLPPEPSEQKPAGNKTPTADNSVKPSAGPTEVKLGPPLIYASSPQCKAVFTVPPGAERLGEDGFVGLELNINPAGVVQHGEISRSSGFAELDEAALKQVKENLTFKSCQKSDAAVGCKQFIKFRWKTLDNQ